MGEFSALRLHDFALEAVHVEWPRAVCTLRVLGASEAADLVFGGFTELVAPRVQPWGPSSLINCVLEEGPGRFQVELQSGDVLRINAATWTYTARAR